MSEKQKIVNVPKDMAADLKERSDYELVCAKLNIAMKGNYHLDIAHTMGCIIAHGARARNPGGHQGFLEWGTWQAGGMQTTAFPLSKRQRKSYRLGGAYRWRIVRFEAHIGEAITTCRLLIAYHAAKEQFRATLAVENDRDMSVVASYEFHGTHPGWHLHAACGEITKIPPGSMRGFWQRRLPKPRARHRHMDFGISGDEAALTVASEFFLLHKKDGLLKL